MTSSDHYYTAEPASAHDRRVVRCAALGVTAEFVTDAGVFSRDGLDTGTAALLEALPEPAGRVLDLGCGWGAVGVLLGKRWPGAQIVMTDVNCRAASLARENLRRNGVSAEVLTGDGFENVPGSFDLIVTNPPIRAGKAAVYRLFADARARLNPGGALYAVIRKQQGAPSALKYLRTLFSSAEVVRRQSGFHVIRAQGALPPENPRQRV